MKAKPFEVTRSVVREPMHSNIIDAIKCIGLMIVLAIVLIIKTIGYMTLWILMLAGFILKLITGFIHWVIKKIK